MMPPDTLTAAVDRHQRVIVANTPTPIERFENLGSDLGISLYAKRDDYTGIGFGGNKVRQLEFYFGAALAQGADSVVITGAVQSNFARSAAAIARRLNLECHVQLEERVTDASDLYRGNGNVLLDHLLGATIHMYPEGEDEAGADTSVRRIASDLRDAGRNPYVIPLGIESPPLGALGYVLAAVELAEQMERLGAFDAIVIGSGSSLSHVGLLLGLRAMGIDTAVHGVCVRRDAEAQHARVVQRLSDLAELLDLEIEIDIADVILHDSVLAPGYGQLNGPTTEAILRTARSEGVFLDPTYTGKTMAELIHLVETDTFSGDRILFWHTGGQPALFAYADQLNASLTETTSTRGAYDT